MRELDANRNGLIDFDEFVSLMSVRSKATGAPLDEESDLREAFKVFDLDGNGTINAEELRSTMNSIRVYLTDEELDLMMKEADEDGNGVIDFQGPNFFTFDHDFWNWMRRQLFYRVPSCNSSPCNATTDTTGSELAHTYVT